ncbi:Adenosine deaminase-like protein A [Chionoecetes opilio]|uniref:Adenosine deaminase-like protein A n=1 Tax=Chionoecetes opilio TaxID=41210 RepID=A0A8J4YA31_CHIOP|nr:Adenosine deaminase-like protein A [Chionoecetes opilio]
MELLRYCTNLPKVELHAHLNGSLSDATVLGLLKTRTQRDADPSLAAAEVTIKKGHQRTLEECFQVFGILHSLTDTLEAVQTITRDVIREFAADNVRYLELRTTPKHVPDRMTKKQYMDAVLQATVEAMVSHNIRVRLLLSIDRARGVEDAWSTLHLAKDYLNHTVFGPLVCGLDVSGNPVCGDLQDYLPVLQAARSCGLKLAVHLAEVPSETEALAVLNSGLVDRIGHGTFLHPASGGSQALHTLLKDQNIPLELCMSSNVKTGTVKTPSEHHLGLWRKENHPLVICTDDKGVFSTSLSEEFVLCAQVRPIRGQTFSFCEEDLHSLSLSGVEAAFLSPTDKQTLRREVQQELDALKGKLASR